MSLFFLLLLLLEGFEEDEVGETESDGKFSELNFKAKLCKLAGNSISRTDIPNMKYGSRMIYFSHRTEFEPIERHNEMERSKKMHDRFLFSKLMKAIFH